MSRILLKYHTNIKFYTQYTHPTLICRETDTQTDAQTDGCTENINSIFRDKLLLLGEHVQIIPTASMGQTPRTGRTHAQQQLMWLSG
jgi:hypothetical protein